MKKLRAFASVMICLCLLFPVSACSGGSGYRIVDTYTQEGSFVIGFRRGDRLRDYVTAALGELAANDTLRVTATSWFGEDLTSVKDDEGAMDELWEGMERRQVIVGVDPTNMPMSYMDVAGMYKGFDVDLANYICGYLGFSMAVYPIDIANADVELNSGNIDMAMGVPQSDMVSELDYSPSYLSSQYVLVTRTAGHIRRKSALKGKTLGVAVTDLDVLQQDEKFVKNLGSVIYQTNTDGLFQALMNGEVDGILVSSVVAAYYMK